MAKRALLVLAGFGILLSAAYFSATSASQEFTATTRDVSPFAYCCIEHQGPFTDIESVIGQLMQALQAQNIMPRGPMVGVYYNSPDQVQPQELKWEIGFPVTEQASPLAPLVKKVWEYKTVVAAVHVGPYEQTGDTIAKVMDWMTQQGYFPAGPSLERYLDMDPSKVDPGKLRTEIWIPVNKK